MLPLKSVGIWSMWSPKEGLYRNSRLLRRLKGSHVITIAAEARSILILLAVAYVERTRGTGVQQLAIHQNATGLTRYIHQCLTCVATVTGSPAMIGSGAAEGACLVRTQTSVVRFKFYVKRFNRNVSPT